MFTTDPNDALRVAHERTRQLREETAAVRLRRASKAGCPLAATLLRLAERLTPAPLTRRPA